MTFAVGRGHHLESSSELERVNFGKSSKIALSHLAVTWLNECERENYSRSSIRIYTSEKKRIVCLGRVVSGEGCSPMVSPSPIIENVDYKCRLLCSDDSEKFDDLFNLGVCQPLCCKNSSINLFRNARI